MMDCFCLKQIYYYIRFLKSLMDEKNLPLVYSLFPVYLFL